jgi:hypothetical protein
MLVEESLMILLPNAQSPKHIAQDLQALETASLKQERNPDQ